MPAVDQLLALVNVLLICVFFIGIASSAVCNYSHRPLTTRICFALSFVSVPLLGVLRVIQSRRAGDKEEADIIFMAALGFVVIMLFGMILFG